MTATKTDTRQHVLNGEGQMPAALDSDEIAGIYDRKGYVKIPGVFSPQEVSALRQACSTYRNGDILTYPEFGMLPFDERVLKVVRALLGDDIVYFGESTALYNATAATPKHRHYHNDSRADDFDFKRPYSVIRVGLYLQDHAHHSGGLKLRPGSHKKFCVEKYGLRGALRHLLRWHRPQDLISGPSFNVNSRPGDLLAWSMRTHHTGYALRLRAAPGLALHPHLENLLPASAFLPEGEGRCVVFMSYGAPGEDLENYIQDRVGREDMKRYWQATRINDAALDCARAKGVQFRTDGINGRRG